MDEDARHQAAVQLRRDLHCIAMRAARAQLCPRCGVHQADMVLLGREGEGHVCGQCWLDDRDQAERVRSTTADPAALKLGKKEADEQMERSLYQRGRGYSYDAVKLFMPAGAKKPVIVPYVEHVPPDVTAGIFWLKNRDPAHWRDAWQLEHVTGKYIISDKPMTPEQWIKERAVVVDGDDAVDVTPALEDKSK